MLMIEESEGKKEDGSFNAPFDTLTPKYSFWQREWLQENYQGNGVEKFRAEIKERIERKIAIIEAESII